ncbi:Vegetative incompatibility protein HET-E-1 [Ceratobasidium sp. AG-Ba]|nr:Vegetative incompatibility protein HET-E-1 [Ceratobasidium sp. AG-Ba]
MVKFARRTEDILAERSVPASFALLKSRNVATRAELFRPLRIKSLDFPPLFVLLCERLGNDRDISTQHIETQFDKLIKEPILAIKDSLTTNSVVVFDALNELAGESDAWLILDLLFRFAADLPVRFFVSSRTEPTAREHMFTNDLRMRAVLHLRDIEQSLVQADIKTYLTEELRFIGPSEDQVKQLTEQAGKLFIYAATAARYILPPGRLGDPLKRLAAILSAENDSLSKRHRDIDGLYSTILSAALEHPDLEIDGADDIRLVLHTVVCAAEPMNIKALANLLGIQRASRVRIALSSLWSVIHTSEGTEIVSKLHASFADYILNQKRSGIYWFNGVRHNAILA